MERHPCKRKSTQEEEVRGVYGGVTWSFPDLQATVTGPRLEALWELLKMPIPQTPFRYTKSDDSWDGGIPGNLHHDKLPERA